MYTVPIYFLHMNQTHGFFFNISKIQFYSKAEIDRVTICGLTYSGRIAISFLTQKIYKIFIKKKILRDAARQSSTHSETITLLA